MKFNKGAMFGLDARIALAIFGALSVISGAALYSAIQASKVTALHTQVQELLKAREQYILDTGEEIPADSSFTTNLNLNELLTSSKVGWKGPYINAEKHSVGYPFRLKMNIYGDSRAVQFYVIKKVARPNSNSISHCTTSTSTDRDKCKVAACIMDLDSSTYSSFASLKNSIDGSGSAPNEGNMQIIQSGNSNADGSIDNPGSSYQLCFLDSLPLWAY